MQSITETDRQIWLTGRLKSRTPVPPPRETIREVYHGHEDKVFVLSRIRGPVSSSLGTCTHYQLVGTEPPQAAKVKAEKKETKAERIRIEYV